MIVANILKNLFLFVYYILESLILIFVPRCLRYKDIKGQIVLITGAGSGIGRCLALRFADCGAVIVVLDLHLRGAQKTVSMVKEKGGVAFAYFCDVSQPQAVYEAAVKVKQEVGKVDILVNNAGIVSGKRLLDSPDETIKKTFEVNSLAHFWTCKAFLPDMIVENKGHIVSISSMVGHFGLAKLTDYCASKFAAAGLAESLRMELRAEKLNGIKSSAVYPSAVSTGMFDGADAGPLGFWKPEFVAETIISGVLSNQENIYVPRYIKLIVVLKALIPVKLFYLLLSILGADHAMDGFKGRQNYDIRSSSIV